MIINKVHYSIFFGDAKTCWAHHLSADFPRLCKALADQHALKNFVLLNQTHGIEGMAIDASIHLPERVMLKPQDGDFLVTDQVGVGLAILTADCMPLVVCDPVRRVVGIAHAGWKGTIAGIVSRLVERMQHDFGCQLAQLQFYLGPSAKTCCYEVQSDFLSHLQNFPNPSQFLLERDGRLFFDKAACNISQLLAVGISQQNIDSTNLICTMCDDRFYSFRRQKSEAGRNISLIWLS
ncbi:peptidoglycan editing factor PgeF [bacterium]|nr:MAG: peptidoglycan editing factor PgeF [bacterium]